MNSHEHNTQQILSLVRLPIPPYSLVSKAKDHNNLLYRDPNIDRVQYEDPNNEDTNRESCHNEVKNDSHLQFDEALLSVFLYPLAFTLYVGG